MSDAGKLLIAQMAPPVAPQDQQKHAEKAPEDGQMMFVGQHCGGCGQLDFLPFKCRACGRLFCDKCRLNHGCVLTEDRVVPECPLCGQGVPVAPGEDANERMCAHIDRGCPCEHRRTRYRCTAPGCTASEAVRVTCKACGGNFCFKHRFPVDHACASLRAPQQPGLLHQFISGILSSSSSQQQQQQQQQAAPSAAAAAQKSAAEARMKDLQARRSANPMWKKIESMRARSKAIGDPKIPAERRVTYEVLFPMTSGVEPRYMFFDENWSVGKVLDKIAEAGKIPNNNNMMNARKLILVAVNKGKKMPNMRSLKELQSPQPVQLQPGDPILLEWSDAVHLDE